MDTNQRKVGRPKAPPRTGPLVLGEDHGRTKVTLEISERTAGELAEYTRWVEQWSGIAATEAKFKTVDFALREIFRRDRVWQAEKRAPSEPAKSASGRGASVGTASGRRDSPIPTATCATRAAGERGRESDLSTAPGADLSSRRHRCRTRPGFTSTRPTRACCGSRRALARQWLRSCGDMLRFSPLTFRRAQERRRKHGAAK